MVECLWKGNIVDNKLKGLIKDLGNAVNDSLDESDRIAEAVGEIQRAGYNVFLVLEATIGIFKREDSEDDSESSEIPQREVEKHPESPSGEPKIKLTKQDYTFLDKLKIIF